MQGWKVSADVPFQKNDFSIGSNRKVADWPPDVFWFMSGRLALYWALKNIIQNTPGRREVLIPAFHCPTIVQVCDWLDLVPVYYQVNPDLSPSMRSVEDLLTQHVAALIVIHYFGFPNRLSDVAKAARRFEVDIIEDAAHVDYLHGASRAEVGRIGAWLISSPRKFYPLFDGGCAVPGTKYQRKQRKVEIQPSSFRDELRAVRHLFGAIVREQSSISEVAEGEHMGRQFVRPGQAESRLVGDANATVYKDSRFSNSRRSGMTKVSRGRLRFYDVVGAWSRRRASYHRLRKHFSTLHSCSLKLARSVNDIVPYVLPIVVQDPGNLQHDFRQSGIETLRWEGFEKGHCAVSDEYESAVIQIPCHQGLGETELRYIERISQKLLG